MPNTAYILEDAGITRQQVDALTVHWEGSVATKADIIELRGEIKLEISDLRGRTKGRYRRPARRTKGRYRRPARRIKGRYRRTAHRTVNTSSALVPLFLLVLLIPIITDLLV